MRVPRLYYPFAIELDEEFLLEQDAAHHVGTVLRLKSGSPVVLFNGDGHEYSAEITDVSRRKVTVIADAKLQLNPESPLAIHLGQGVSKGDRMDTVLQKSVELGVTTITPILTERCAVKLDDSRWQKKCQQWQKIIISACEQCGRNTLPTLNSPISLNEWLAESTKQTRLVLAPGAPLSLAQTDRNHLGYRLLIGPEGGLSEQEVHQATECGFAATSMGPRILRTETAAIAGITLLQGLHGDF